MICLLHEYLSWIVRCLVICAQKEAGAHFRGVRRQGFVEIPRECERKINTSATHEHHNVVKSSPRMQKAT